MHAGLQPNLSLQLWHWQSPCQCQWTRDMGNCPVRRGVGSPDGDSPRCHHCRTWANHCRRSCAGRQGGGLCAALATLTGVALRLATTSSLSCLGCLRGEPSCRVKADVRGSRGSPPPPRLGIVSDTYGGVHHMVAKTSVQAVLESHLPKNEVQVLKFTRTAVLKFIHTPKIALDKAIE